MSVSEVDVRTARQVICDLADRHDIAILRAIGDYRKAVEAVQLQQIRLEIARIIGENET